MSIVVPFGPQHPVLPEPLQLRLEIVDEQVTSVVPVIGYVHRGLERLAEQKDFQQDTFLIEHICGICSFIHSTTYCMGLEEMMGIEIPPRAKFLRTAWGEMHRLHSHLLALGLLADAFGFESLFMQIWRTREHIMDAMEYTTGGRVMLSAACVGGVRKDITPEGAKFVLKQLDAIEKEVKDEFHVLMDDYTVKQRMVGVGVLDPKTALERGAVGPTARGCGIVTDHRMTGYKNSYQDEGVIPTAFIELENGVTKSEALDSIVAREKEMLSGEREMALAYTVVERIPYTLNGKADFKALEKVRFEDIDYVIVDDPIFDDYFIHGENPDRIKLNGSKTGSKKLTK